MLRMFVCAVLALTLATGLSLAGQEKKKKNTSVRGTIKKVDAKEGTITVTVKKKKSETEKEFKVSADTKVVILSGDDKKEFKGKDGLKDEAFKEGAKVTVVSDAEDATKVKQIRLGEAAKKKK